MASESPARATKGRAPHRRDDAARIAVLNAADDLVAEQGFGAVTIEGIARRAGVAKQTIYRWWPSKVEILLDTLVEDAPERLDVTTSGTAAAVLRRYARAYARFLGEPAGKVMLALLGEAQHDPAVAATFRTRFLQPQRERERGLVGGIDADPDALLDRIVGPILLRALTGAKTPQRFVDALVDDALAQHVSDTMTDTR